MPERDFTSEEQRKRFGAWITECQDNMKPRPSDRLMAQQIGISATHLGVIKRGETGTKRHVVTQIAFALGADVNVAYETAGLATNRQIPDNIQLARRLERHLQGLPREQRQRIEDLLEQDAANYRSLLPLAA